MQAVNGATLVPNASANGIAVPQGYESDAAHLVAVKSNVADLEIYGYMHGSDTLNTWVHLDAVSFSGTNTEAQLVRGVTAYQRLATRRTDANVSNTGVNIYWGFSGV